MKLSARGMLSRTTLLIAMLLFGFALSAHGQTIVAVTTVTDEDNGSINPALGTGTSLREAITFASASQSQGGVVITFNIPEAQKVGGVWTINLIGPLPVLTGEALFGNNESITINGPGAKLLTVRRNSGGDYRIFDIQSLPYGVSISGMTIRDGLVNGFGAGILANGHLNLTDCVITNNEAVGVAGGGGVALVTGTVHPSIFTGCTISNNIAGAQGGGINFQASQCTLTLQNCTISDNTANGGGFGAGIYHVASGGSSVMQVTNCTISNNVSVPAGGGGGIATAAQSNGLSATTFLSNTILAANTLPNLTSIVGGSGNATITSQNYNLASDGGAGFLSEPNDKINTDPMLGPLQDNGGQTPTRALLPASPARNMGSTSLTSDQRGVARPQESADDIGAFELAFDPNTFPAAVTVTTTADTQFADNRISLREAIVNANASSNATITFAIPDNQKVNGVWTIGLTSSLPDLTQSTTITGPGAKVLTVRRSVGDTDFRIFNIPGAGHNITISDMTIRDGRTSSGGGGIASFSPLVLSKCSITNNESLLSGGGGGVYLRNSSGLFDSCTFSSNTSADQGGGILYGPNQSGQKLTLRNCTVSGNTVTGGGQGGGIQIVGIDGSTQLQVSNCTIANNVSSTAGGGGINTTASSATATTLLDNTILAGNTAPNLVAGIGGNIASFDYNLSDDSGGGFLNQAHDQVNTNPMLGNLADNGGPTLTHRLFAGTPAVDMGNTALTIDQRGAPRPLGVADDIGAYELTPEPAGPNFVVTTTEPGDDLNYSPDDLSLYEAIRFANANSDTSIISFNIPEAQKVNGVWAINLAGPLPDITQNTTINGPGAKLLTVRRDTGGSYRIFFIASNLSVALNEMTIRDGMTNGNGGGILSVSTLSLTNCLLTNNTGANGGGVALLSPATFTGCTFASNTASARGGAIYFEGRTNRILTLNNCTVSGNTASALGGGILHYHLSSQSTLRVINCTVTNNHTQSGFGGGIVTDIDVSSTGESFNLVGNTIIANNTLPNYLDFNLSTTSLGFNLLSDDSADYLPAAATDQINTDPLLGPLQDNGGSTPTHASLINSPVVDQGKRDTIAALATNFDQRGFTRPVDDSAVANASGGDASDIGAVEIAPGVHPISAACWKTHGSAGDFPIDLPLSGSPGIECRSGGANGDYKVIVTFAQSITYSGAAVVSGVGNVSGTNLTRTNDVRGRFDGPNGAPNNQITVNLTGVANAQVITVALLNVSDGMKTGDVGIRMGVLVGDTNSSGNVTATDVSQVKSQSGQPVSAGNFRSDVVASGVINATDVSLVKSKSGTALP